MSANNSRIAVLGAGTMGHGIAYVAALSGYEVQLCDADAGALERGLTRIHELLDKAVARGKLEAVAAKDARVRLAGTVRLAEAVSGAELVIESVFEKMDLKRAIFAELDTLTAPTTVLATNTSSMSVTEIAAAAKNAGRVIGMHFFNPPYALKLLEIVRAEQTTDATVAFAHDAGERLGREMITVSDSPGFATSRLGVAVGLEAIRMVEAGVATAADIDKGMKLGYGYPMGPLELADHVGLDIRLAIAEYLHRELGGEQFRPPPLLRRMVRAGKLGKKTGQGFYTWEKGK